MTYLTNTTTVYLQFKYDYISGVPLYFGKNTSNTAAGTDATWVITKFAYDVYGNLKREILTGAWDSRTALAWTI